MCIRETNPENPVLHTILERLDMPIVSLNRWHFFCCFKLIKCGNIDKNVTKYVLNLRHKDQNENASFLS